MNHRIVIAICLIASIFCIVGLARAVDLSEVDKQKHAGISAVCGIAADTFVYHGVYQVSDAWRPAVAFSLAMVPGVVKELIDTNADWHDIEADAIGSAAGVLVGEIVNRWIGPSRNRRLMFVEVAQNSVFIGYSGSLE